MNYADMSTQRLLEVLKQLRKKVVRPWAWYDNTGEEDFSQRDDELKIVEIRKILASREHVVGGKEGRRLAMKAKRNP